MKDDFDKDKKDLNVIEGDFLGKVKDAQEELDSIARSYDYTRINNFSANLEEQTEKLVSSNKIPNSDITTAVAGAGLAIDLTFASMSKTLAIKSNEIEGFLSEIEDRIFDKDNLKDMSPSGLLNLYAQVRMVKSDNFKMMREIRGEVDFDSLQATLLSLQSKETTKNINSDDNAGILDWLGDLMTSAEFIKKSKEVQEADE